MVTENELDIRGCFACYGQANFGLRGSLGFALLALACFLCKAEVGATAITDRPTVNMLGGFYSQQQFLRNPDIKANLATPDQASVMDEAYKEFVMQLASPGTRVVISGTRRIITSNAWWATAKPMPALLDDLINNIQFMPGDALRNVNDSVKLIAETAPDANNLLRQYVAFASQRAASHLNETEGAGRPVPSR